MAEGPAVAGSAAVAGEAPSRRRLPAQAGAALVEASAVLVVLVALVGAVTVVSSGWGRSTSADHLASRAVRMAARVAEHPASDLDVLSFVGAGLGEARLERLLIYRPPGSDGAPTSECAELRPSGAAPAGVSGWCSAYGPGHLDALTSATASTTGCGPVSWEGAWCPAGRREGEGAPSWIGVVLELRVPDPEGWSGSSGGSRVTARAVAALDPQPRSRP